MSPGRSHRGARKWARSVPSAGCLRRGRVGRARIGRRWLIVGTVVATFVYPAQGIQTHEEGSSTRQKHDQLDHRSTYVRNACARGAAPARPSSGLSATLSQRFSPLVSFLQRMRQHHILCENDPFSRRCRRRRILASGSTCSEQDDEQEDGDEENDESNRSRSRHSGSGSGADGKV
jgi:hypothetical protein